MSFNKIVFIGGTNLLYSCADIVLKEMGKMNMTVFDISSNILKRERHRGYKIITGNKTMLMDFLRNEQEKCLVFSIMNPYIIESDIVTKNNLVIINLHHGLLPLHPGRNAEAWAIYDEDQYGGFTWHIVSTGIDDGDIILQKKYPIDLKTTSLKLLKICGEGAKKTITDVLNMKKSEYIKQSINNDRQTHYAKEIPNDGFLNIDWNISKIVHFLNAMDYGILFTLGNPKIRYDNVEYKAIRWKIVLDNKYHNNRNIDVHDDNNTLIICEKNILITIQYERIL